MAASKIEGGRQPGRLGRSDRLARESLTVISNGLEQRPEDGELQLRRAVTQFFLGAALSERGNPHEALETLEQATAGLRNNASSAMMFGEDPDQYAGSTTFYLAKSLAQTGQTERAKSLIEPLIATLESVIAQQPENLAAKKDLPQCWVLLACLLDPTKPDQATRRQTLLNEAEATLTSPAILAHQGSIDREVLAKNRLPAPHRRRNQKIGNQTAVKLTSAPAPSIHNCQSLSRHRFKFR